ncbi:MAG: DUF58 domain-containing protein [Ignavibacteriae bacterium]|nr:DUF58 domain-containing protein [Ignavibacteriota bacterium]
MDDHRKYLDPKATAELKGIDLKARMVVEGFITGLHKSPYHGFSVEFAEHRPYRAGDEVKNIDWKVYGRSNRYYVKQYEEETNLRATILVDVSASMGFASEGHIPKVEYASYLAASLGYMMMKQRDSVGLALYDKEVKTYLPSKSKPSYLNLILKTLEGIETTDETHTASALDQLADQIKRRGLIIIISDLFDDIESISSALKHFRHKENEIILFQLLDPRELDFDFGRSAKFIDLESKEEMVTNSHQLKESYQKAVRDFTDEIKNICYSQNVDYNLVVTSDPFDKALREFLSKRAKI